MVAKVLQLSALPVSDFIGDVEGRQVTLFRNWGGLKRSRYMFYLYKQLNAPNVRKGSCRDSYLVEAWDRMHAGGVQIGDSLGFEFVHREWGHDFLGVSHGWQLNLYRIKGI